MLRERYEQVKASLPPHVELVAVSKTRSAEEILALYDLGQRAFGENYPQELAAKQPQLPADIAWHFIGHLQTNKVKLIAPFVQLIHGVDSARLLDEIDKRAGALGRSQDVLLQVHIAREETKHGFSSAEVTALLARGDAAEHWPNVRICGLMGMATLTEDRVLVSAEFHDLHDLFKKIQVAHPELLHFTRLSMGMSNDAALAIAAGSNLVRIGTALFGERPSR